MNKNIFWTATILCSISMPACNKLLDINNNPNAVTSSSNDLLLSGALLTSLRLETQSYNEAGALWTGYWGKANDITVTAYGMATSSFEQAASATVVNGLYNELWETAYTNIYNLNLLRNQSSADAPVYAGIAEIIQGMHFLQLVDVYNNVPFSQALNPENLHPSYDSALNVYQGAVTMISKGISDIASAPSTSPKPSAADILFNGNTDKWIQLANTLKLRALLQLSNLSAQQGYIKDEMQKIATDGRGFITDDAMMNPGFAIAQNQQSPFWDYYFRDYSGKPTNRFQAVRPTRYLLSVYDSMNDPRKEQIYAPSAAGGKYVGVVLGQLIPDASQNAAATSAFLGPDGGLVKQAISPAIFFSAAESYFLQAEAVYRGWLAGSVEQLYQSGINASFNYTGLSQNDFNNYIAQPKVALSETASNNVLKNIILQKWLALNGIDEFDAWNDFRRLNIPSDIPGSSAISATGALHINRLLYPTSEVNTNGSEVSKQGNIDPFRDKIFWQN